MSAGWIKLHRRMLNWEWFDCPNTLSVFLYVLLSANHKPGKWRGIVVLGGQCITSVNKIAVGTGLTIQEVRTALKHLEKTGELTVLATNKYTLINVIKWALYQSEYEAANKQTNKQTNKQANKQTNKQANNKQEDKKYKENKEDDNNSTRESVPSSLVCHVSLGRQDVRDGTEDVERKLEVYRLLIHENIGYEDLAESRPYDMGLVNEFVAIIIDVAMSEGGMLRVGNEDKPREVVKSQLLKLTYDDIEYAIDRFKSVTGRITKKKQYILTMLYNCKMERDSHYTNAVKSDMFDGGLWPD